jgi:hypothetical protein
MKSLFIFFALFILSACDSPMNHRISLSDSPNNKATQTLGFDQLGYKIETRWMQGPFGNINRDNHLLVFVFNPSGRPIDLDKKHTLSFYATMPSMGHPMEDAGYFEHLDTGIYMNKSIRYNMPGDWRNELWIMNHDFEVLDQLQWNEQF